MENPFYQNPQLDGKTFFLQGGDTGVLLTHGFTATTVEVRAFGEYLHKQGYTVSAPLLPGHGTRPEDLLKVSWRDWVDSVELAYGDLSRNCKQIIAGGESLGGLLTLYLAYHHPEIEKLIILAPALRIKKIWLTQILWPFIKMRPKGYGGKDLEGHLLWQGYRVIVVRAANELRKLQNIIYKILPEIHQPVLIFQSRADHTIVPKSSQEIFRKIGSTDKELIWLDKSNHTITLGVERDMVFQRTLAFLNNGNDQI